MLLVFFLVVDVVVVVEVEAFLLAAFNAEAVVKIDTRPLEAVTLREGRVEAEAGVMGLDKLPPS